RSLPQGRGVFLCKLPRMFDRGGIGVKGDFASRESRRGEGQREDVHRYAGAVGHVAGRTLDSYFIRSQQRLVEMDEARFAQRIGFVMHAANTEHAAAGVKDVSLDEKVLQRSRQSFSVGLRFDVGRG